MQTHLVQVGEKTGYLILLLPELQNDDGENLSTQF
jgi:hypothetical protein